MIDKKSLKEALKKAIFGFLSMFPMLFAIILLLGIFDVFIKMETITSLFVQNSLYDTIIGSLLGGALTGNPMISYLLSGELTKAGISLFVVTSFLLSWVTLGVVQLPAEVEIFGLKFTSIRTILTFLSTILVSFLTVSTFYWLS